jgi:hypothetical protein
LQIDGTLQISNMSNGNWYSKASSNTQKSNEERDFLLKTIEEQKDQLNRIQSKFKGNQIFVFFYLSLILIIVKIKL